MRVLLADKELVIFPIISTIGVLVITLTFALPMFLSNFFDTAMFGGRIEALGLVVLFLFYVVQYTVIFFANTALVGAALIRLRGGDPTVGDGFRIAASRIVPIIGYALIAATVGVILRGISRRSNGIGRLIASLVGFAWNVATYLVVPVLAVENVGPLAAIQRSAGLLRRTWGEQIAGNLGLGAIFTLFYLLLFVALAPVAILALNAQSAPLIIGTVVVFVLVFSLLRIPAACQRRVLLWGVVSALVMRGVMIVAGVYLIERFHWMIYLFAALLLVAAVVVVLLGVGVAFLSTWDIPAPTARIEKVIPNDRFAR